MAGKGGKKGKNGKTGKTQIKGKAKTGKTQARNSNPPETPEREGQHGSSASVAEAEAEAVAEDSSSSPSSDSYCLPEDAAALPTAPVPNASRTTLLTARIFNYEPPVRGASADAAASRGSGADGSGGGADAAASGGDGDGDGNGNSIPPAFIFMPVLWTPNGWRYEMLQVEMDMGRDSGLQRVPAVLPNRDDDGHDHGHDHEDREDEA
jgi:hypothetical protein